MIKKYKQNLNFFLNLIDARIADSDYLGALDASRRAYTIARTKVAKESLNLVIAEIYFDMKLYSLSCEYFFRATQINEVCASALFGIGACLVKLNHYSLACEYFEECLLTPSNVDFSLLIENYLNQNKSQQNTVSIIQLAKKLLNKNKPFKAIKLLENQSSLETQILLAKAYIATNQFDSAREIIFDILKLNPAQIDANLTLCELCYIQNDLPNLATILSNLSAIPPNFSHYMQISHYYCALENWEQAIKNLTLATNICPYSVEAEIFLSLCHLNKNDKKEALFHIGKAKWIDDENSLVNELSDLIQKDLLPPPVFVTTKLPNELIKTKQNDIVSALSQQFCKSYHSSMWLQTDVDWALGTHNSELTQKIVSQLSKCNQSRIVQKYKNYLLSTKLTREQKFYLIKYAILNSNMKKIYFTQDYRIKTLCKIPKKIDEQLLTAYASAISYCAIFDIFVDLKSSLTKISLIISQNKLTENEKTCLFFCKTEVLLKNACLYFNVNFQKIKNIAINFEDVCEK